MKHLKVSRELVIKTITPVHDLSTIELVERVKTWDANPQSAYGLFVKNRMLKPEISMKEFTELLNAVQPNPHEQLRSVTFEPTHKNKNVEGLEAMVVQVDPRTVEFILSNGNTGADPVRFFEQSWEPIQ